MRLILRARSTFDPPSLKKFVAVTVTSMVTDFTVTVILIITTGYYFRYYFRYYFSYYFRYYFRYYLKTASDQADGHPDTLCGPILLLHSSIGDSVCFRTESGGLFQD